MPGSTEGLLLRISYQIFKDSIINSHIDCNIRFLTCLKQLL